MYEYKYNNHNKRLWDCAEKKTFTIGFDTAWSGRVQCTLESPRACIRCGCHYSHACDAMRFAISSDDDDRWEDDILDDVAPFRRAKNIVFYLFRFTLELEPIRRGAFHKMTYLFAAWMKISKGLSLDRRVPGRKYFPSKREGYDRMCTWAVIDHCRYGWPMEAWGILRTSASILVPKGLHPYRMNQEQNRQSPRR